MPNNKYLMAARAVVKKINDKNFDTILVEEKPVLMSNMYSFEIQTKNSTYDFFNDTLKSVFSEILDNELYNISYLTYSIKGNGFWRLYLILKDIENNNIEINENDKLKKLYLETNNGFIKQKTRKKSCRTCESIINLDAFFGNPKFKYKDLSEPIKCPVCYSETGFYSKTIQERIKRLQRK